MYQNNTERSLDKTFNILIYTSNDENIETLFNLLDKKFIKVDVDNYLIFELACKNIIQKGFDPNFDFDEIFKEVEIIKTDRYKYYTDLCSVRQEAYQKHEGGIIGQLLDQIDYKNILLISSVDNFDLNYLNNKSHKVLKIEKIEPKNYILNFFN